MIVRPVGEALQLVTQPDHAHLSRHIVEHCAALRDRPRRELILLATGEHDNGWIEEDAAPSVHAENGAVVDFVSAPLAVRHRVWPRATARLAAEPWAAALVAQHAITVYDRFRAEPAWAAFFALMEQARDAMLAESGLSYAELANDYVFVRLGDLISLLFCTGGAFDVHRFGDWSVHWLDTRVVVTPDPFDGRVIPIRIDAKMIPGRRYRSDDDLRDEWQRATTTTLSGEVAGSARN